MRIVLRRLAKLDLLDACNWYNEQQPGLGDALGDEVEATLKHIAEFPEIHPRVDLRVRRAALARFPFGIFYIIGAETIRVIAILHRARRSELWRQRLQR